MPVGPRICTCSAPRSVAGRAVFGARGCAPRAAGPSDGRRCGRERGRPERPGGGSPSRAPARDRSHVPLGQARRTRRGSSWNQREMRGPTRPGPANAGRSFSWRGRRAVPVEAGRRSPPATGRPRRKVTRHGRGLELRRRSSAKNGSVGCVCAGRRQSPPSPGWRLRVVPAPSGARRTVGFSSGSPAHRSRDCAVSLTCSRLPLL